jgi:hypothetical protein
VSLHPLDSQMLMSEVAITAGGIWGGIWLWGHQHPVWAVACWLLAGLMVVAVVSTAIEEKPPAKELAGKFAVAFIGAGYLFGLGFGCWRLWTSGYDGSAVLLGIFGLWGVPLGLAAILNRFRKDD